MLKMLKQHYIRQAMFGTSVYKIIEFSPCLTKGFGLRLSKIDDITLNVYERK
jgi:hypothetical protein